VLDELLGFAWDVHNVAHIALHDVTPAEVEQTTRHRHLNPPGGVGARREALETVRANRWGAPSGGRFHDPSQEVSHGDGEHHERGGKEDSWPGN
jgi:hypothetical protein